MISNPDREHSQHPLAAEISPQVESFAPVLPRRARLLILGSMPGTASLQAQQYYAHPRNRFWPIMESLLNAEPDRSYPQRVALLRKAGVALWDVLQQCRRSGSLDSAIVTDSEQPNPIAELLRTQAEIHVIATNGGKATAAFRRHVEARLPRPVRLIALPSTSPANARMSPIQKLQIWRRQLGPLLQPEASSGIAVT